MSSTQKDFQEIVGSLLNEKQMIELISNNINVSMYDLNLKQLIHNQKMPLAITQTIVLYIRIPPTRPAVQIGNEFWVRIDSQSFQRKVKFLSIAYPWATKNRKLDLENDAFLEGLELWQRFRTDYNLHSTKPVTDDDLSFLREIVKHIDNRAIKHCKADLVTMYKKYMLFSNFDINSEDIFGSFIKREDFWVDWELYGDNVDNLSTDLDADEKKLWKQCIPKITHFKAQLLAEILQTLYACDIPNAKVRRIHLSSDTYRDLTKYIYDLYVGHDAILFQRVHSD